MGLQVTVDDCSVPWTEAGTAPAYTYTCTGTTTSVLASRPVIGANVALANLTSVTAGHTDNLRVTLTLPATADNTLQNQSSTIALHLHGHPAHRHQPVTPPHPSQPSAVEPP